MYRDEMGAARARFDEALSRHERARARIDEQLEAIAVLNEQLERRQLSPVELPEVARALDGPTTSADLGLAELVRGAGAIEDDVRRLDRTSEDLTRLFGMLQDRVQGRRGSALPLGPAPRPVPLSYGVSEWLGGVCLCTKLTIFFPPIWAAPFLAVEAAIGGLVVVLLVATLRAKGRLELLRWAKVAEQVTVQSEESTNTKNTNVPMRHSQGWEVTTRAYTGYTMKVTLAYFAEDGSAHSLSVRGVGYDGGVLLYDGRRPERAMAIEKFDCTPRPDFQGRWERGLRGQRVWVTSGFGVLTLVVLVGAIGKHFLF